MRKWSPSSSLVMMLMDYETILLTLYWYMCTVGEEDEVSIRDIAYMVAEAMEFKGELVVSELFSITSKIEFHSHIA